MTDTAEPKALIWHSNKHFNSEQRQLLMPNCFTMCSINMLCSVLTFTHTHTHTYIHANTPCTCIQAHKQTHHAHTQYTHTQLLGEVATDLTISCSPLTELAEVQSALLLYALGDVHLRPEATHTHVGRVGLYRHATLTA